MSGIRCGVGLALASILAVGCSQAQGPAWVNPSECSALVEEHRLDPGSDVDTGPSVRRIGLPGPSERSRESDEPIRMHVVIDETGQAMLESLEVEEDLSPETMRSVRNALTGSDFQPASRDGCWVPATFSYTMDFGRR